MTGLWSFEAGISKQRPHHYVKVRVTVIVMMMVQVKVKVKVKGYALVMLRLSSGYNQTITVL
jgi:hypothetical protein